MQKKILLTFAIVFSFASGAFAEERKPFYWPWKMWRTPSWILNSIKVACKFVRNPEIGECSESSPWFVDATLAPLRKALENGEFKNHRIRVLEVGFGTGVNTKVLAKVLDPAMGDQVIAVEPQEEFFEKVRDEFGNKFPHIVLKRGNLIEPQIMGMKFDFIFTTVPYTRFPSDRDVQDHFEMFREHLFIDGEMTHVALLGAEVFGWLFPPPNCDRNQTSKNLETICEIMNPNFDHGGHSYAFNFPLAQVWYHRRAANKGPQECD
ncbi:class I SAM-dependent methyltransferase [bacterium]|nr:class I SAM-dependent methyltransferase [bacterium]